MLRTLDERRAGILEKLCELIVPGSARVGPVVYIDAVLTEMPPPARDAALAAVDVPAPSFARARSRPTTATSSRRGRTGPGRGRRSASTHPQPRTCRRTGRTWGSHEGFLRRRPPRVGRGSRGDRARG